MKKRVSPELEYIFKHSLTQEAAYNSLLIERRKEFHLRVGQALEQLFADRQAEFYGLLAHHFDAAGEQSKAVNYLIPRQTKRGWKMPPQRRSPSIARDRNIGTAGR